MKRLLAVLSLLFFAAATLASTYEEDLVRINIAMQLIANQHKAKPDDSPAPKYEMLDFTSQHCLPCQQMKSIVDTLKKDYKVVEVDTDANPDWVQKYSVKYIPCYIILQDGKEVKRFTGTQQEKTLRDAIQGVFEVSRQVAPEMIRESICST